MLQKTPPKQTCNKEGRKQMNLMAGHQCPIIYRLYPEIRVDIKNGQLKAIKAALRLSQHLVHTLMFEVGYLKPIFK